METPGAILPSTTADVAPLIEEDEASWSGSENGTYVASRRVKIGVGMSLIGGMAVVLAARTSSPTPGSVEALAIKEAAAPCAAKGDSCIDSGCCIDGGDGGLQCYKKNDNFAECYDAGACEPGVHEGETEKAWDQDDFAYELVKWSCEKVGETSKPGCSSFKKESKCPTDRCGWGGEGDGECREKCGNFPSVGSCWDAGHCMWEGEKCQDACWEVDNEDDCAKLPGVGGSRCQWQVDKKGKGKCGMACHVHGDQDCPSEEQCMVADGKCQKDPCSAQWEDCRETKCCSTARGAAGMTCFEKDETYATCLDLVDPEYQKGWTGKKIGNRTKFEAGCSWAGQDCTGTHMCCNEGYNCAVKDENFAGCQQNTVVSTWVKQHIDLPAGWDGTILGGWRGEYAVEPVPEGGDMSGVTMHCIMVVLPDSMEEQLLQVAKDNTASIFQCESHKVYNSWKTDSASWDSGETTVINTAVFLKVFEWVRDDGDYLKQDWTVKVDPDCVFMAERLRNHMYGLRPPPNTAIYLKNNDVQGMGNSNFLGAIEVFSKRAIQIYLDNDKDCGKYLGTNSGEDGFFKGCMDALGVGFMHDHTMFKPNFDPAICTNGKYAAYHPMKYPSHWQRCWNIATGQMCQGLTYDCGGVLDPPISAAGIR